MFYLTIYSPKRKNRMENRNYYSATRSDDADIKVIFSRAYA